MYVMYYIYAPPIFEQSQQPFLPPFSFLVYLKTFLQASMLWYYKWDFEYKRIIQKYMEN